MSDIRFNQWLHQSGTGGVSQDHIGNIGIGTTNPSIVVSAANTAVLNVGVITANNLFVNNAFNGDITGNVTGNISGATGTFSGNVDIADKIIHTGDTDTAMRFPADNTFAVDTAGTERLRITSAGLVGIGTDNPNSAAGLDILNGEICARGIRSNAHKPISGVWLGKATGGNALIEVVGDTGSTAEIDFTTPNTDTKGRVAYDLTNDYMYFNTNGANERVRITSGGLVGVNCTPLAQFQVKSGTNQNIALSSMSSEAAIEAFNDAGSANVSLRLRGSDFKFYTSSTERLRITSAGNVGIGTDAPANILHLRNDAPIITSEATNNSSGLRVNVIGQTTDTTQLFRVQDSNTTKFTILRSGNVGVMDSAPSSLLSISQTNGNAKLQIKRSNTANNTDDYGSILWRSSGGTAVGGINVARETAENNGYMFFQTANGGSLTERLRISADGGIIKGSANSATSSQIIQTFFNKRGSVIGKRVHQGSSSGSTTHNLLTINSFQSNNTRFFAYVTVHYVNPISNLGGRMETYAGATTAGARVTGTFTVADGGRWGNPGGTLSLSWSGNTLQLNTYNNAYMEYSVDITYVAYDGASVTFIKN
jgi:hypothetical protein